MLLGGLCHQNDSSIISSCMQCWCGEDRHIDIALEQAARENVVDIPAIVTKMRRQCMKMVQNSVREANTELSTRVHGEAGGTCLEFSLSYVY